MKNRRNLIISFLLCACLIVGVGYAALVDILDVNGTAEYNLTHDIDKEIRFVEAKAYDDTNTTSISATNDDKITFSVLSLANADNVAFFRFKVASGHNEDVTLYLSSFGMTGTHTGAEGNVEDVYEVKYLISGDEHAEEDDLIYGNMHDADKDSYDADEEAHTITAVNDGDGYAYVYVAVKLKVAPAGETVTATFALEFAATVEDVTVAE